MTEVSPIPATVTLRHVDVEATSKCTDALYRRHRRSVAHICRSLLRDRSEAEDATQQVFLSAHRALLRGAAPHEPGAWLAAIARNECRARIRARMSTPLAMPDDSVDRVAPDPPAQAIQQEELAAFWRALADLPLAQRDALLLREIRGLSYDQLAEQLALSQPSVRSLLGRARQRLRLRLRDIDSGLAGFSWLETLARLFTGGGNPGAPVAAKVAALGLGAAAITGGAVVTPEVLEHHVHSVKALRVNPRTAHHAPSVRRTPQTGAAGISVALRSGEVDDRRRERGRSHRDGRGSDLRTDRASNAGPGERVGADHVSGEGQAITATTRSGHNSDSSSTVDGVLSGGSGGSGTSGRDGSGSGDGSSTASSTGDGSNLFSSGDSGSSSSSAH
jgi:RNA polymerase sigma-70 factor (ECF subfamily)